MPLPPRRWFQFRLSTWFVLVAIFSWAMMEWPLASSRLNRRAVQYSDLMPSPRIEARAQVVKEKQQLATRHVQARKVLYYDLVESQFNYKLLYPALALTAFVGGKAAWEFGRRVAGRKLRGLTTSSR